MHSDTAVGSAWGPISPEHALEYADLLQKALECQGLDPLLCMQSKSIEEIFEHEDVMQGNAQTIWNAVPDYMFTMDPFIPGEIEELLENGHFNHDIQVIAGTNKDEGILYFLSEIEDPSRWENWKINFDSRGPMTLFNIGNSSKLLKKTLKMLTNSLNIMLDLSMISMKNTDKECLRCLRMPVSYTEFIMALDIC